MNNDPSMVMCIMIILNLVLNDIFPKVLTIVNSKLSIAVRRNPH